MHKPLLQKNETILLMKQALEATQTNAEFNISSYLFQQSSLILENNVPKLVQSRLFFPFAKLENVFDLPTFFFVIKFLLL